MRQIRMLALLSVCGASCVFAGVDSTLLGWVPASYTAFVGMDFEHARSAPLSQYMLSKSPNGELFSQSKDFKVDEMIKETGFDPRKDLYYGLAVFNVEEMMKANGTVAPGDAGKMPVPATDFKGDGFLVLLKGRFDMAQIHKSLEKEKPKSETYQGEDVFSFTDKDGSNFAMTFTRDGVFVLGSLKTLRKALDDRAAHVTLSGDVLKKVQMAADGQDFWVFSAVDGSAIAKAQGKPADADSIPQLKALQSITEIGFGVRLGAGVDLAINAKTKEEKDAQSLADGLRFLSSMAQLQRSSSPEMGALAEAFDGMKLESPGNTLHFGVTIPEKTMEDLVDKGIEMQKQEAAQKAKAGAASGDAVKAK